MNLKPRIEEWGEEPQTLDVIHVEVGEQDVDPGWVIDEVSTDGSNPGSGVQDDNLSSRTVQFDRGRVTPISDGVGSAAG
jgi:hypothetical protein